MFCSNRTSNGLLGHDIGILDSSYNQNHGLIGKNPLIDDLDDDLDFKTSGSGGNF